MRKYKPTDSLSYFAKYRWYLRALNAKKAEKAKILADINSGEISRDTLDKRWSEQIRSETSELRRKLSEIELTVEAIPETAELLPCKLFLRLHFILGMSMTDTAEKMNVSISTARRIRERASEYFESYPFGSQ